MVSTKALLLKHNSRRQGFVRCLEFQALKFRNSGPEIWRMYPPPPFEFLHLKGRCRGVGFQTGGFPDLDLPVLICPFWSVLGTFPIFSGFSRFVFPEKSGKPSRLETPGAQG